MKKITVEDLENAIKPFMKNKDIPYEERQVYAAFLSVPIETCMQCPYLKRVENNGTNVFGQIGSCCYCRQEAKRYNMTGKALCMK